MRSQLLFIVIYCWLVSCAEDGSRYRHFPRILWTYWDQGFQNASTFTKLCLNNQQHYANISGWTFNLLSKDNIHRYINVTKLDNLWRKNGILNLQAYADIIRVLLLLEYGGMWMDANSFFIEDLSWIDTLVDQPHIYNKFGDYPNILLGSYTLGWVQPQQSEKNTNDIEYNVENWLMMAIPHSQFFSQVLKTIQKVSQIGRQAANDYYKNFGVINPFNSSDYFLLSDYIFQVVIQLKSRQQNSATLSGGMSHYKIWNLQATKTVFMPIVLYDYRVELLIADFFDISLEEYKANFKGFRYFIKLTGVYYPIINKVLDNYKQLYCSGYIFQIKQKSIINHFLLNLTVGKLQKSQNSSFITQNLIGQIHQYQCQQYFVTNINMIKFILVIISAILIIRTSIRLISKKQNNLI